MPTGSPMNIIERIERRALEMRDDECWLSDRATVKGGYVQLEQMRAGASLTRLQHVIAWEAYNAEPVPKGMVVMHTCDNPGCFNPAHLTVGTQSDNIRDCVRKGRFSCHNATKGKGTRSSR